VVDYRRASFGDITELVENMREADRAEVEAASSGDVADVVAQALWSSPEPMAALHDGYLLTLFGYAPVAPRSAVMWLLGTDMLPAHYSELARVGRVYIDAVQRTYPYLFNYVDARNAASKVWLRRLGFTLHPAEPYGVKRLPFHRFEKGEPVCA